MNSSKVKVLTNRTPVALPSLCKISKTLACVLISKFLVAKAEGIVVTIGEAFAPYSQPKCSQKAQY